MQAVAARWLEEHYDRLVHYTLVVLVLAVVRTGKVEPVLTPAAVSGATQTSYV